MPSDVRAVMAREAHRRTSEGRRIADQDQAQRDQLVRTLHDEGWSYSELAGAVGCSESLIAAIVKGRTGRRAR